MRRKRVVAVFCEIGAEVVGKTEGFSFAYMKDLFLSSMMQWMAVEGMPMNEIILDQAVQLRKQMATSMKPPATSEEN